MQLLDAFDLNTLWDDYGVVGDLVPFTVGFPRADIHELLSPDILHQVIKGTFKDHLVAWVGEYLGLVHGTTRAAAIMADIDRRIAAVPSFPGLRHFPEGRGFKQWTGDDSKALMKVYLPALAGHVPPQMLRALSAFMDFCYLVRRDVISEDNLKAIDVALDRFQRERIVFEESGVQTSGFSLPRQHSILHYRKNIQLFAAPNGLCSSITEAKHIKAVKEPWRRSSRFEALGQMLVTNARLDKLSAARVDFDARGMLVGPCSILSAATTLDLSEGPSIPEQPSGFDKAKAKEMALIAAKDDDGGPAEDGVTAQVTLAKCPARGYPGQLEALAEYIRVPQLTELTRRFLYDKLNPGYSSSQITSDHYPDITSHISVFPSAIATYYAPSDYSGIGGALSMRIGLMVFAGQ
ncbi:hypothetical protein EW026_g7214 [Hermanssonia centrifuga]|uniref:Uncharacterized protein n=1 Tax=Hermanssonia centrifuga TaxID=98765 RepID=A0A4S4K8S4_9APHY|nr:hypothetical protein EW026_g7214 [Hermanssonia centrifuga]